MAPGDKVTVRIGDDFQRLKIYSVQVAEIATFNAAAGASRNYSRYIFRLAAEGETWARGWDTEDAHALEALALLQWSAG